MNPDLHWSLSHVQGTADTILRVPILACGEIPTLVLPRSQKAGNFIFSAANILSGDLFADCLQPVEHKIKRR
jgi:hypothetical protein